MKPDSRTVLKPFRTNLRDVPRVGGLKEKDGWVNMQVQFLIDQKTAQSDKLVVGWTVLAPGAQHDRHRHFNCDEFWIVVKGHGVMYTEDGEVPSGEGDVAARQFDAALMSVGFKLSADLLERLSGLSEATVVETAERTLGTVREMAGDHVEHNVYFVDFPANVPDTFDFWMECLAGALADDTSRDRTIARLSSGSLKLTSNTSSR